MKKSFTKLATSTLLTSLLLSGCGGENSTEQISLQQPHTKKVTRELKDWTWNVDTTINKDDTNGINFTTYYYDNIPEKIKHFQFFIDSDDNTKTGFSGSDGWEVFGADYLIEDNTLYKSLSNTEYKWKQVGKIAYRDNKKGGDERVITLQCPLSMAKEIQSDKANVYIEPYDANWVGEYFTIPLPNITIESKIDPEKALINTVTNAIRRGASHMPHEVVVSPDHKLAIANISMRGYISLKVYDITNPSQPVKKFFVSHNIERFSMPNYGIDNLKVLDDKRVSYTLYERTYRRGGGTHMFAPSTGIKYDVITDYTTAQILSAQYSADSKADARSIIRKQLKDLHGNSLTYFRFDYALNAKYGVATIGLNNTEIKSVYTYDLTDRNNPKQLNKLFDISSNYEVFPHLSHKRGVRYRFLNDNILVYYIANRPHSTTTKKINYITKEIPK